MNIFYFVFWKIPKRKNVRRLNVIRSEKKNPKTGRNPQERAKAWHAALLGTKHYIRYSSLFLCPSLQKLFIL